MCVIYVHIYKSEWKFIQHSLYVILAFLPYNEILVQKNVIYYWKIWIFKPVLLRDDGLSKKSSLFVVNVYCFLKGRSSVVQERMLRYWVIEICLTRVEALICDMILRCDSWLPYPLLQNCWECLEIFRRVIVQNICDRKKSTIIV